MMKKIANTKIAVYGSAKEVELACYLIEKYFLTRESKGYGDDRLRLKVLIDQNKIKASILYDGNTVYGSWQLIPAFKRMYKAGGPEFYFTDALYKFFSLACGSIAHYNINGWAATYPTNRDMVRFFRSNEMGCPVVGYTRTVDSQLVAEEMAEILGVK